MLNNYYYSLLDNINAARSYEIKTLEDGKTVVEVALPGYNQKEVGVMVEGGQLFITAKNEKRGEHSLIFNLSDRVDQERISAKLEAGILMVELSSNVRAKKKKIEVR